MAVWSHQLVERQVGNARTEAGVWSPLVIVSHPLLQNCSQMPFIQHDQPVETLATDRTDQPLAVRVRLRAAHGRPQHCQTHRANCAVDGRSLDAVAVVNEKSLRLITRRNGTELLHGPCGRRMLRHIPVQIRRVPTSRTTKTYSMRNLAVMVTRKSQASMALAWLRTKVLHRWDETRFRGRPPGGM
jgi:hypothetical protein